MNMRLSCQVFAFLVAHSSRTSLAFSVNRSTILKPTTLSTLSSFSSSSFKLKASFISTTTTTTTTTSTTTKDYGVGMDQQAMMESDILIVVDSNDALVGKDVIVSKKQAHSFNDEQPRGICHRAFSLFIFNPQGNLLLTQRAASKITFPSVWTNTCCSHPLVGMTPNEVDIVPDAYPQFDGIKHAAIRKAKHELGIQATALKHSDIQFISRFHYWAADTLTHGPEAPWGEHEVDYILFCQMEEPEIEFDPDEVANYKYVSIEELKEMMKEPSLLWSPWFLGIMERGGFAWWQDLEGSLQGKYTNQDVIFFDPTPEHVAKYNLPSHTRQTGVLSSSAR